MGKPQGNVIPDGSISNVMIAADANINESKLDAALARDTEVAAHAALTASHGRTNIDGVTERDAAIAAHAALTASHGRTNIDGVTERDAAIAAHAALAAAQGSYVGNGTADQAVAHGLGRAIKGMMAYDSQDGFGFSIIRPGYIRRMDGASVVAYAVTSSNATNFYVGNAADFPGSANSNGVTYWFTVW